MTETVLVTGGRGRSGRWICDRLAREGWQVVAADYDHPGFEVPERDRLTFRAVDLTDRGQTLDLLAGVDPDAVVHWAAIPVPTRHPGGRVFETNTAAAHNVLVGAGRADARTVLASSESVYGFAFAEDDRLPDSLPVDERHPKRPADPYGTSKVTSEELAKMVTRRHGISVASIRPSWIQYPGEYNCLDTRDDLSLAAGNFWSYVDVRDVARLVALALDADVDGFEPLLAVADDNFLGRPTVDAIEDYFGTVPEDCTIDGEACAFSNARAAELLEWTPEYDWRTAADADVAEPSLLAE
jgi:nucleoside-diphosphate-sugar epimerase